MTQIALNARPTGMLADKQVIVTTSWDDGHPLDLRLAELLASYGVAGTFYVPLNYDRVPPVTQARLLSLQDLGMEIGAHGIDHTMLTKTKDLINEVVTGKTRFLNSLNVFIRVFANPMIRSIVTGLPFMKDIISESSV